MKENKPMFRVLDKIGAYPKYFIFKFQNKEYEIVRNEKDYIVCFDRKELNPKHIKIYKYKLLSNKFPSLSEIQRICDIATYLIADDYNSYSYDYDLKQFIKKSNEFIYKVFKNESNPFKKIKNF